MKTIEPSLDMLAFAQAQGVIFCRKDKSVLMRLLWFLKRIKIFFFLPDRFMTGFWTTIGSRMYYPTSGPGGVGCEWCRGAGCGIDDCCTEQQWQAYLEEKRQTLEHEFIHVLQRKRFWYFYDIAYLLLPVPFFFAWCRWYFERAAYLHEILYYKRSVEGVVQTLWHNYGWTYSRHKMRRWFLAQIVMHRAPDTPSLKGVPHDELRRRVNEHLLAKETQIAEAADGLTKQEIDQRVETERRSWDPE